MKPRMARMLVALGLLGGLAGCSDELVDLFLEDINNIWTVEGDPNHTFFFETENPGRVESANFTGREELPDGDAGDIVGRFEGRNIQFTSARTSGTVAFAGTFRDENTMEIRGGGETLVVRKGG